MTKNGVLMSLKYKISKEEFEALEEGLQALYQPSGEGYQAKVEGIPEPEDTSGLKQKVEELLNESKTAKQKAREIEERARQEAEQRAKEENDFKSLYESSEGERSKALDELKKLRQTIAQEKTDSAAMKLAAELADGTNAELLSTFIKGRIRFEDGKVQVLDANGNPTVSTVEDLKKEFQTSGRYDALLRGNKSGGGGAAPSNGGGAATKKFNEMTGAELKALKESDPDAYKQLRDEYHNR